MSFLPSFRPSSFLPSFLAFSLFQIHNLAPPTFQLVFLLAPPPLIRPPDRPTSVHTITHSVARRAGDAPSSSSCFSSSSALRQIPICLDTASVVEPFVSVTVRPSLPRNGQRWRRGAWRIAVALGANGAASPHSELEIRQARSTFPVLQNWAAAGTTTTPTTPTTTSRASGGRNRPVSLRR